jgi:hypothetical protein
VSGLQQARDAVHDALSARLPATVYLGPPRTMTTPCVVIRPGDPWMDPDHVVRLEVECHVRLTGPALPALVRLEALVGRALELLSAGGIAPGDLQQAQESKTLGTYSAVIAVTHRTC